MAKHHRTIFGDQVEVTHPDLAVHAGDNFTGSIDLAVEDKISRKR